MFPQSLPTSATSWPRCPNPMLKVESSNPFQIQLFKWIEAMVQVVWVEPPKQDYFLLREKRPRFSVRLATGNSQTGLSIFKKNTQNPWELQIKQCFFSSLPAYYISGRPTSDKVRCFCPVWKEQQRTVGSAFLLPDQCCG